MSSIKVAGVGGLGMVALIVFMAMELPVVRWFVALALAGGLLCGIAFIGYRRWVRSDPPHGPTLMVESLPVSPSKDDQPPTDSTIRLVPAESARSARSAIEIVRSLDSPISIAR